MTQHPPYHALPFPLRAAYTVTEHCHAQDKLEHLQTLLMQSTALTRVLMVAAESGHVDEELPATLEVLHGYVEAALAMFASWQEAWQAHQAEAEAKRHAWVHRPLPPDVEEALAELRTLLEQYDTPEGKLRTALLGFARLNHSTRDSYT
jgi:hypothetical protein